MSSLRRIRAGRYYPLHWPFLPWARVWLTHPSGFQVYLVSAPRWRIGHRLGHARLLPDARRVTCPGGLGFVTPRIEHALALIAAGIGRERNPLSLLPTVDAELLRHHLDTEARAERRRETATEPIGVGHGG